MATLSSPFVFLSLSLSSPPFFPYSALARPRPPAWGCTGPAGARGALRMRSTTPLRAVCRGGRAATPRPWWRRRRRRARGRGARGAARCGSDGEDTGGTLQRQRSAAWERARDGRAADREAAEWLRLNFFRVRLLLQEYTGLSIPIETIIAVRLPGSTREQCGRCAVSLDSTVDAALAEGTGTGDRRLILFRHYLDDFCEMDRMFKRGAFHVSVRAPQRTAFCKRRTRTLI